MADRIKILGLVKDGKSKAREAKRLVNKYCERDEDTSNLIEMAIQEAREIYLNISIIITDEKIRDKIKKGIKIADSLSKCRLDIDLIDEILPKLFKNYTEITDLVMENIVPAILASPDNSLDFSMELFDFMSNKKELEVKNYIYKFRNLNDKNSGSYWCLDIFTMLTEKLDAEFIEYYLQKNSDIFHYGFGTVVKYLCEYLYLYPEYADKIEFAFEKMLLVYGKYQIHQSSKLSEALHILYNSKNPNLKLYQLIIQMGADTNYTEQYRFEKSFMDKIKENNFIDYPLESENNIKQSISNIIINGASHYFISNGFTTYCDINGVELVKIESHNLSMQKLQSYLDPECQGKTRNVNAGGGSILNLG